MRRKEPEDPHSAGEVIYGLRASLAAIERRPDDVISVAFNKETKREVDRLRGRFDKLARSDNELARLADSQHHEGIAVLTHPRRWASPTELADKMVRARGTAIALDRVRNPYNIGAILRTAAFFGVDAAILGSPAPHPALPRDAIRVAEGGVEHLLLSRTTDLADTLARLRKHGVHVIGTDVRTNTEAIGFRFDRPVVLVVGHEREGMSDRVRAQCDALVKITGSGAVESLNVGVATGVLIAEMVRR
jgi:RNA methyltransferase, TrmH family